MICAAVIGATVQPCAAMDWVMSVRRGWSGLSALTPGNMPIWSVTRLFHLIVTTAAPYGQAALAARDAVASLDAPPGTRATAARLFEATLAFIARQRVANATSRPFILSIPTTVRPKGSTIFIW